MNALTPTQAQLLDRHAGTARQAWNWATARWLDWQASIEHTVWAQAAHAVGLDHATTTTRLGDALLAARALLRGHEPEQRAWQSTAYTTARATHGHHATFEDAYTLAHLYRLTAAQPHDPTSPDGLERLHWWAAQGTSSGLPRTQQHGVSTFAYQTALADFAKTAQAYWARPRYSPRTGRRLGAPRFKRRGEHDAFAIMNLTTTASGPWKCILDGHRLLVPNLGSLRLTRNTRELRRLIQRGGRPTSVRFTRTGGRWHLAVNVSFEATNPAVLPPPRPNRVQIAGGAVGVDLGITHLATLSTGTHIPNPRHLTAAAARLENLQQRRDRQHRAASPTCFTPDGTHKRGRCTWGRADGAPLSRRARTTQAQITRLHALLATQRASTLHQLTKHLATRHERVAIENLNPASMTRRPYPKPDPAQPGAYLPNQRRAKAGLNRALLDAGFGEFRRQLTYKTTRYGSTLTLVPPAGTSQTCHHCGHRAPQNRETQADFVCVSCGHVANADINAACNIRDHHVAAPTESQHPAGAGAATHHPPVAVAEQTPPGVNETRKGSPVQHTRTADPARVPA
ncbi:RNA-guided endonuclease TnpB family protein [Miniimonas sp. S16]|uniref:RNA-guided endonuclease InsQ/TnpB family protein n=1 Tax=Miniimonas sp. S16 TaxID=2171623 RepID=UPI00131F2A68|nr:RNA-guided endonuclease TnpB family protein [Miniimonas sp. S16]